tara:strand:- start:625 stop:759 length:135 start_codon:yes stop_codon:yes gene_type:complete
MVALASISKLSVGAQAVVEERMVMIQEAEAVVVPCLALYLMPMR